MRDKKQIIQDAMKIVVEDFKLDIHHLDKTILEASEKLRDKYPTYDNDTSFYTEEWKDYIIDLVGWNRSPQYSGITEYIEGSLIKLVPEAKSFFSKSATFKPRVTASNAIPAPVIPPPMMSKSNCSCFSLSINAGLLCALNKFIYSSSNQLSVLLMAFCHNL